MTQHRGGSGNFAEDRQRASEAGQKGGQHSSGNFKNDPERASEQVIKVASRAGGILKMTVNAPLKRGVKVASTATAAVAPDTAVDAKQRARRGLTGHL